NDDCGIKPARIEFHISTSDKGTAAKEHNQLIRSLDVNNVLVYTDGSLLEGAVGTGIYLRGTSKWQEQRHRRNLGTTMEVYDAELLSRNLRYLDTLSVVPLALWFQIPSRGFAG